MSKTPTAAPTATWQTLKGVDAGHQIGLNEQGSIAYDPKTPPVAFTTIERVERNTTGTTLHFAGGTSKWGGRATKYWVAAPVETIEVPANLVELTTDEAPAAPAKPAKVAKAAQAPSKCECGCGKMAARRFLPGHDAKLKGQLIRTAVEGGKAGDKAREELASRGWSKFLEASEAKAARVAAKRAQILREADDRAKARVAKKAAKAKPAKATPAPPAETRVTGVRVLSSTEV